MFVPRAATAYTSIATTQSVGPVISDHGGKDVPRGTLREIIDQAGFTVEEYIDLL
jgi:hypothetical protein